MLFQKNNFIVNEILEDINNSELDLINLKGFNIPEKYYTELIKEDKFELDFLEKIYTLEEKFKIKFFASNWPKGFKFSSYFTSEINIEIEVPNYEIFKDSIRISIEEDILEKKRHKVEFSHYPSNTSVYLGEIFDISNKLDLYSELDFLINLTIEDLKKIYIKFFKDSKIYWVEEKKKNDSAISDNVYYKLLNMKFDCIQKKSFSKSGYSYSLIRINYRNYSKFLYGTVKQSFRQFDTYNRPLYVEIFNNDIENLKIYVHEKRYLLKNILNFIGYNYTKPDWEILLMLSERDILVLAKIIEKADKEF